MNVVTNLQVFNDCTEKLGGGTARGKYELCDPTIRASIALDGFRSNFIKYLSHGEKYGPYFRRIECRTLLMQTEFPIRLVNKDDDLREVNSKDECRIAINEGFGWPDLLKSKYEINPCREVHLDTVVDLSDYNTSSVTMVGSPYTHKLTNQQLAHVGRAAFREMFVGHRDMVLIEVLPHIKLSKTVFRKLMSEMSTKISQDLAWTFYNESRRPGWWNFLRSMGYKSRNKETRTAFINMVGMLLVDALGPQINFPTKFRTTDVMGLLQSMRESEDFSQMPILADALMDAGYDEDIVLAHYRDVDSVFSLGSWIFRATGLT